MLKLFRRKSQNLFFCAGAFLFSISAQAQDDDGSGLGADPAADIGEEPLGDLPEDPPPGSDDDSYELTPDAGPASTEEPASPFPDEETQSEPESESPAKTAMLQPGAYTVLAGFAKVSPSGVVKDLVGSGVQYGLLLKCHRPVSGAIGLHYGLDLRMAKLTKDLSAPSGVAAKPSSRLRQTDVFGLVNGDYLFSQLLTAFFDFGLGVQYRALYINADSDVLADDYYAGYGFGYVLRLGGQFAFPVSNLSLVTRLYFGFEGGSDLESGKLKYNRQQVDINARQSLVGLDLGLHF